MTMKMHRWDLVGSPAPIAKCKDCGLHKATRPRFKWGRRLTINDTEFSKGDGEVIAMNPGRVPPCEKGLY